MLGSIKDRIKQLAQSAVAIAEKALGSSAGKAKKQMAVDYVVSHLPVPSIFKKFIAAILSNFIDEAIEFAVEYMNTLEDKNTGEIYG